MAAGVSSGNGTSLLGVALLAGVVGITWKAAEDIYSATKSFAGKTLKKGGEALDKTKEDYGKWKAEQAEERTTPS